jgi:hypothetical protein
LRVLKGARSIGARLAIVATWKRSMDELFRRKILALLDQRRTMRPAGQVAAGHQCRICERRLCDLLPVRPPDSQKASNLARDDRVSLAIDDDPAQVMDIAGLSMAARANVVADPTEAEKAIGLLMSR